jgi:cell volume regulation protein A
VREGDYVYLLAPPEKAQALDRFFVDMPPPARPDPRLLGDFFVPADATLGALAEIYGLEIGGVERDRALADFFADQLGRRVRRGDIVPLGAIALVAHTIVDGRLTVVGLRLSEPERPIIAPFGRVRRFLASARRALRTLVR